MSANGCSTSDDLGPMNATRTRPTCRPNRGRRLVHRLALAMLAGLVAVAATSARAADPLNRKALESLASAWAKARPKTKFEAWDPLVRADLWAKAKALGPIGEGTLDDVRDVFWKALKANPPGPGKKDKPGEIQTPYGRAWWIEKSGSKSGLVLGLHGGGEGAGNASEAAGKWSIPGCMAMYPQGIKLVHDTWNTVHGERFLLTLIETAKVVHDVDPDRVYSCGFSMGGTGSWFMAGRHADLLAGAAPCAGVLMASPKSQVMTKEEVRELQPGFVPNVRNLAMYWFIGLADDHCMPGTYLLAWDQLADLRGKDADGYGKLQFSTYPGLGHSMPPGEPSKALDWLSKQRRDALPQRIVWEQVDSPFPQPEDEIDRKLGRLGKTDFYWLHCDRPADRARVVADRKGNEFDVTVTGGDARDLSIWLHPKMIDPAHEVIVRVDGKEMYRGKPVPDVLTVLESLDARVDRVLTFDRRVPLGSR
jgi:dienelactone hydrolase